MAIICSGFVVGRGRGHWVVMGGGRWRYEKKGWGEEVPNHLHHLDVMYLMMGSLDLVWVMS